MENQPPKKQKVPVDKATGSTSRDVDEKLANIYYDVTNPAGFSSVKKLAKASGVSFDETKKWLTAQEPYTLHRAIKRKFKRNRYIVPTLGYFYEADLADFQKLSEENDNMKFVLCVTDLFSKKVAVEPIINKSGKSVSDALKIIFSRLGVPENFRSDRGLEFLNSNVKQLLKNLHVKQIVTDNEETKCACIERWIRTLRERLARYFTHFGRQRYVDIIQDVVEAYNNSKHSGIGMAPNEVNTTNTKQVWAYLYSGRGRYPQLNLGAKSKPRFKIGDTVKISKHKHQFKKGHENNWTHEVFKVTKIINRQPVVYKLKDSAGEDITGVWYEHELQKVTIDDATEFRIEEILEVKGKGASKRMLVKWLGWPEKFNGWIYAKDLKNL